MGCANWRLTASVLAAATLGVACAGDDPPRLGPDAAPFDPVDGAPRPGRPDADLAAARPDASPPCADGDAQVEGPDETRCYFFVDARRSWGEAAGICNETGARLATISSAEENDLVAELASGSDVWLGAHDADTESVFRWIDDEPFEFTNFDDGEPNDDGGEDCLLLLGSGRWDDRDCGDDYKFVCER